MTASTLGRIRLAASVALAGVGAALLAAGPSAAQDRSVVDVVEVRGIIDVPTADFLADRIAAAQAEADVIIIQIDTPGGLDVPMRQIIQDILDSDVPVVVWVAPRGARAASAGTFITYSANLAYMATSTELGAATPINLGGETDETLARKATNDAAAFITELAIERGRNEEWAEAAVREAASIGATEAAEIGVVDGIATSLEDVLRAIDGETVEVGDGSSVVIEAWDEAAGVPSATLRFQDMNPIQRLLHAITDPEIAFFLLLIGFYGIVFELYNPGIGLAGILGAVSLLMGLYSLSALPTNWAGAFLIVLSVVFFIVDLQAAGLGIWTVGGVAGLVAGGLILFSGASPELALSPWAVAAAVAFSLLFFVSVMTAALRVRLRRPITGEEGIVGMIGTAETDIAPEGTVLTKGTRWRARTMETGIAAGSKVQVKASEGLLLLVEPLHEEATGE